MDIRRSVPGLAAIAGAILIAACSSGPAPAEKPAEPAAAAPPPVVAATPQAKRVFFIEPAEGASLKSPVHFKFGADGITISPVPPDPITTVRPDTGHYHLGIDTDCLASGTEIVKGTPTWVHFGKGDDVFDSQFTPGPHKVSLQIGDDKHVTVPGFCQTISFTVTP